MIAQPANFPYGTDSGGPPGASRSGQPARRQPVRERGSRATAPLHWLRWPQKFLAEHRVDDNKFADWRAAEEFFTSTGFSIERRLVPRADSWPVRETWTLRARA